MKALTRIVLVLLIPAATASAKEQQEAEEPKPVPTAAKKAWEKYEKQVQKNRETYDKANEKVLALLQKELEKLNPPVKVDALVHQFQQDAIVKLDAYAKPPAPPPPNLRDGVVVFRGHRYKLFIEELSWEDARKKCEDLGGHLLVIEDNNEHEFLKKEMRDFATANPQLPKFWHVWLGLRYDETRDKWFSPDGRHQPFSSWERKTPGQERAAMRQTNGNWFSMPDNAIQYFICEWVK